MERFSSHTGIQGLSGTPNFAHLGPWERTIIKEIDLKQLKHRIRHASGRWPGEFLCLFNCLGGGRSRARDPQTENARDLNRSTDRYPQIPPEIPRQISPDRYQYIIDFPGNSQREIPRQIFSCTLVSRARTSLFIPTYLHPYLHTSTPHTSIAHTSITHT